MRNINTKKTIVIFNKNDLPDFQTGKNLWISKIKQLKKLKNISISCTLDIKNVNILVELNNFIGKNLLTIDTLGNDDYFFSEKRQIDIVQKIVVHIKDALMSLDDLEISVNYLDQAVKLLDELFGKNNYEDRLGYILIGFVSVNDVSRGTIMKKYDVLIIGAGHAGVEAAIASDRIGAKTALISFKKSDLGVMSCNPAMGGLGKGHLIREIDAMGGVIGLASDHSGIQFRMLNRTRGEAVQGPRAQIDRDLYKENIQRIVRNSGVELVEGEVRNIITERKSGNESIIGVETCSLGKLYCKKLVVTTGTFLSGVIYRGKEKWKAGRLNARPSFDLAKFLKVKNIKHIA